MPNFHQGTVKCSGCKWLCYTGGDFGMNKEANCEGRRITMNILDWSKNELDRLLTGDANKDDMQILINADILQMVKTFSEQGHSGFSAAYAISLLKRLLDWKPVQPLTGEDSEWGEIRNDCEGKTYQQNLRCSAVFRDNQDNATAYHIYGKVFSDDGGKTWFSNQDSVVPVEFPYHVPDKAEHVLIAPEQEVSE